MRTYFKPYYNCHLVKILQLKQKNLMTLYNTHNLFQDAKYLI